MTRKDNFQEAIFTLHEQCGMGHMKSWRNFKNQDAEVGKNLKNPERMWRNLALRASRMKGRCLSWGQTASRGCVPARDSDNHFRNCSAFGVSTQPVCGTKASPASDTNVADTTNVLFPCFWAVSQLFLSAGFISWLACLACWSPLCSFSHSVPGY